MKKIIILSIASLVLAVSACKKKYDKVEENHEIKDFKDIKVDTKFDWTAAKAISIQVNINDNSEQIESSEGLNVRLYDQEFTHISNGFTDNAGTVEFNMNVPASVEAMYVYLPATGNLVQLSSLSGNQILNMDAEVKATGKPAPTPHYSNATFNRPAAGPDCNTGCGVTKSGTVGDITIESGQVVCMTGTMNGNVTFNDGGTLRICGTATINNFNFNGNGTAYVIVTSTGKLTTGNFNINNEKQVFQNYGTTTINSNFSPNNTVDNYGTLTVNGDLNTNGKADLNNNGGTINMTGKFSCNNNLTNSGTITMSEFNINGGNSVITNTATGNIAVNGKISNNASFTNNGTLTCKSEFNNNSNKFFHNYGSFTVDGDFSSNTEFSNYKNATVKGTFKNNNGTLTNTWSLTVNGDFQQNTNINNNGYIKVLGTMTANNGVWNLADSSMVSVGKDMTLNGKELNALGKGAIIKIAGTLNINNCKTNGKLDLCASGNVSGKQNLGPNVYYCNSGIYIPKTPYNPDGYGVPEKPDADNDGIEDKLDAFPTDVTRAFEAYDPYIGYKVNAFEDLWPFKGDYDFNDVVIKSRSHITCNAKGMLVDAEVELVLSGLGGTLHSGLAMQFLVPKVTNGKMTYTAYDISKYIQSISTVSGPSKAEIDAATSNTIIFVKDIKELYKYQNNGTGESQTPESLKFKITFKPNTAASIFATDLFIYMENPKEKEDVPNRAYEIHMSDRPATAAADKSKFGTGDDKSNPENNTWYKTELNHPWGIEIYTGKNDFSHPLEKKSIIEAYPEFGKWAESLGLKFTDWYLHPNTELIFVK